MRFLLNNRTLLKHGGAICTGVLLAVTAPARADSADIPTPATDPEMAANLAAMVAAGGFRDFTRIAASNPVMWRDVFLNNKDATLEILGRFTEELFALQRAIRTGDGDHLFDYFTRTRAIRRGIIEAGQDTDAPDFGRGGRKT